MKRKAYQYFTHADRMTLYRMYTAKYTVRAIAAALGKHVSSIYRELKRGKCTTLDTEYRFVESYSPDIAHLKYREHIEAKGPALKVGNDHNFAQYVEDRILKDGLSPDAVLGEIKRNNMSFKTRVSTTTLYSYIDKGVFPRLTTKHLLYRGKRKTEKKDKQPTRPPRGPSIEKRSQLINNRMIPGHWEMDTVYGPQGGPKDTLLVLTERKSRMELILPIPDRTAPSVIKALNKLERQCPKYFPKIFKSITMDNGSEFSNVQKLANSPYTRKRRSALFYCHPYRSGERGSNENANGIIRRFIPKGSDLSQYGERDIAQIQRRINAMPRKLLHYSSAQEEFEKFISTINPALCNLPIFRTDP